MSHVVLQVTLPDKLKEWRQFKGLSQEDAAEYLEVPTGTLQGWEQGRHQPNDLAVGAILRAINRYPVTIEDRKKYNNKQIAFRELRYGSALLSGDKGELLVSTNGEEGWAEVHIHQWAAADHKSIRTAVINLSEAQFRSITPVGSGFLLDWSRKEQF